MSAIAKLESKREALAREIAVITPVEEILEQMGIKPRQLYMSSFYGSQVTLCFTADAEGLAELLKQFPPYQVRVMEKGSCLSFKPYAYVTKEFDLRDRVEPVTFSVEESNNGYPCFESGLKADWFAEVSGVVCHITVRLKATAAGDTWPRIEATRNKACFGRKARVLSWELRNTFYPLMSNVRWASGSREVPGSATLYATFDENLGLTAKTDQFVARLIELEKEAQAAKA